MVTVEVDLDDGDQRVEDDVRLLVWRALVAAQIRSAIVSIPDVREQR
jgi:hypothetical protein